MPSDRILIDTPPHPLLEKNGLTRAWIKANILDRLPDGYRFRANGDPAQDRVAMQTESAPGVNQALVRSIFFEKTSTLHISSIKAEGDMRGKGIGRGLVSGALLSAMQLGASRITLLAADQDGAPFWASHGFHLENPTAIAHRIGENLSVLSLEIGPVEAADIRASLNEPTAQALCDLARNPAQLDGKRLISFLFNGVTADASFSLHNREQCRMMVEKTGINPFRAPVVRL